MSYIRKKDMEEDKFLNLDAFPGKWFAHSTYRPRNRSVVGFSLVLGFLYSLLVLVTSYNYIPWFLLPPHIHMGQQKVPQI